MPEVPRRTTPASANDVGSALVSSLTRQFGQVPSRELALLLLAQLWIESGAGAKIQNNNPGNLTALDTSGASFWRPPWFAEPAGGWASERDRALHAKMLAGQAPRAFLSFASLQEGVDTYVDWLRRKFPSILRAAETGDARATADAIQASGYCPDCPPESTATSLATLRVQLAARGLFGDLASRPLVPAGGSVPASSLLESRLQSLSALSELLPVVRRGLPPDVRRVAAIGLLEWLLGMPVSRAPSMGGALEAAVRRVQQQLSARGLYRGAVDGWVGKLTWAALFAAVAHGEEQHGS